MFRFQKKSKQNKRCLAKKINKKCSGLRFKTNKTNKTSDVLDVEAKQKK